MSKRGAVIGSIIGMTIVSLLLNAVNESPRGIEGLIPLETAKKSLQDMKKFVEPILEKPFIPQTWNIPGMQREPGATGAPQIPDIVAEPPVVRATGLEQEIHDWTNHYREVNGLKQLTINPNLIQTARGHSQDMANRNFFDHINLRGQDPTDRAAEDGFHCRLDLGDGWYAEGVAENLWRGWTYSYLIGSAPGGYYTQSELAHLIVDSWMESPGHRQNILTDYRQSEGIGVIITKDGEVYATQNFC